MSQLHTLDDVTAIARELSLASQAFINGRFVAARSGKTLATTNPATGRRLATSPPATSPTSTRRWRGAQRVRGRRLEQAGTGRT